MMMTTSNPGADKEYDLLHDKKRLTPSLLEKKQPTNQKQSQRKMADDDPLETDEFRDVLSLQRSKGGEETPYVQAFYTPKRDSPRKEKEEVTMQPVGPEHPITRTTRAAKRKETPGPSTAEVQTDPSKDVQTDPMLPLRAGAVKRRRLEDPLTKADLNDAVTRLTNTLVGKMGKLSRKLDDMRTLIDSQGTRIGVMETRVQAMPRGKA